MREPRALRSASRASRLLRSHHRLQRPGWNCPSSSGAQMYTGTCSPRPAAASVDGPHRTMQPADLVKLRERARAPRCCRMKHVMADCRKLRSRAPAGSLMSSRCQTAVWCEGSRGSTIEEGGCSMSRTGAGSATETGLN